MALRDSLAQTAIRCLNVASHERTAGNTGHAPRYDARSTSQPDSWLLERCWQSLADGGYGPEAYSVAALAELRQPLSPIKALYRMAQQAKGSPAIVPLIQVELSHTKEKIFGEHLFAESSHQVEFILHAAASAALVGEELFAVSCLERLDQLPKAWDRVFVHPHLRQILSEAISLIGVTPLTGDLIDKAILRYTESGAQFLQQVAACTQSGKHSNGRDVLRRCVSALHNAVLGSLHSRKIGASVFALAGDVTNMLEQVRVIATIQDAHRETNAMLNHGRSQFSSGQAPTAQSAETPILVSTSSVYNDTVRIAEMATTAAAERSRNFPVYRSSLLEADSSVIRQVSRTSADTDVDFLVYTLKAAIESLSLEELQEEQKRTLINQLSALGLMSDGWTAAGATSALLTLGGIDEAIQVVGQIDLRDPTRIESVLALVNGLLEIGEVRTAQTQSRKAIAWASTLSEQSPGRTLRRGLASAFIDHNLPEAALAMISSEQPQKDWRQNVGQLFPKKLLPGQWFAPDVTEEQLHAERVRFAAHLKQITNQLAVQNGLHQDGYHSTSSLQHQNGQKRDRHLPDGLTDADADVNRPQGRNEFGRDGLGRDGLGRDGLGRDGLGGHESSIDLPNGNIAIIADIDLPPELDELIHNLSSWAPRLLEGDALVTFYRDNLLIPLLGAGKLRYAWGLLPHMAEALLKLQSNKMPVRLQQLCDPMAAQIAALRLSDPTRTDGPADTIATAASKEGGIDASPEILDDALLEEHPQIEAMNAFLVEFMADLWTTCAERGIWPTIYAIDGCLPTIAALFGPEPLVQIAQATVEQGALWDAR